MNSLAFAQAVEKFPKALGFIAKDAGKIEFIGDDLGVAGYKVTSKEGRTQTVYVTTEGGVIAGLLFDDKGRPVTLKQLQDHQAETPEVNPLGNEIPSEAQVTSDAQGDAKVFLNELQDVPHVQVGKGGRKIVMFSDLNCPHCHNMWSDMKDSIHAGDLTVVTVFVPFLEGSAEKTARYYSWDAEGDWLLDTNGGDGDLPADIQVEAWVMPEIQKARVFARKWGISGTPTFVTFDDGKVIKHTGYLPE